MNYREKIRSAIACPQFGDDHYGEWGALKLDQRKLIKRLLDELNRADEYIKSLYQENQNLKMKKHKAVNYMKANYEITVPDANIKSLIIKEEYKKIIEILGEDKNE